MCSLKCVEGMIIAYGKLGRDYFWINLYEIIQGYCIFWVYKLYTGLINLVFFLNMIDLLFLIGRYNLM